jgi:hypothetical protein
LLKPWTLSVLAALLAALTVELVAATAPAPEGVREGGEAQLRQPFCVLV